MGKELPKGWVETELDAIFNLKYGKGLPVKNLTETGYDVYGANGIIGAYSDYHYKESRVIISCRGAASGAIHITNPESFVTSNSIVLDEVKVDVLNQKYLFYIMKAVDKADVITGTAQPQITIQLLKDLQIPLPPRAEQDRIVAKVDALMAQHAAIQQAMERIPQLLKDFRQQVLTQAVIGKLTEEWRGSKSLPHETAITLGNDKLESIPEWKWINLNEVAELQSGHTPRKSVIEYWENGNIPWISLQDIRAAHGLTIFDTKLKPTQLGIDNSSARMLPKGTVCFSRDISVGYTTIMGKSMATTQHFANWICGENLNNYYLQYALMASSSYLINKGKGTTVRTLYYKDLKEFYINLPPFQEQQEIVRRVESLFEKATAIEQRYEQLKSQIDSLPQAILHKAFKGELVPQLDSDGSAVELLREIEEMRMDSNLGNKKKR